MQQSRWYESTLIFSLGILALALPWSNFLMSIGVILPGLLTLAHFIKDGFNFKKIAGFGSLLLIVYLLAIIGLIYSSNLDYGLNDLRKKLPLFVLPVVVMANRQLLVKHKNTLINVFAFASLACAIIYLFRWFLMDHKSEDYRQFVPLLSHIRFSVCLCISFLIVLNNLLRKNKGWWINIAFLLIIIASLWQLRSLSGIALLSIVLPLYFYKKNYIKRNRILIIGTCVIAIISIVVGQHYYTKDTIPKPLPEKTALGNYYHHDTNVFVTENNHYIYLYLAYEEMDSAWQKRTGINAKSIMKNGYNYEAIITRYLSSKNLPKDASGIKALTQKDIENIKNGITNYKNPEFSSFKKRINALFFEFDAYLSNKDVEGHSATMRIEYADVAFSVFKKNRWIGTGTGDIADAIEKEHQAREVLSEKYRKRTHNQLLTFLTSYGIVGFTLIVYIILAYFLGASNLSALNKCIVLLLFISFWWEDVLETQAGICTFVFFYALLFDVEDEDDNASSYKASIPSTIVIWLKSWARL